MPLVCDGCPFSTRTLTDRTCPRCAIPLRFVRSDPPDIGPGCGGFLVERLTTHGLGLVGLAVVAIVGTTAYLNWANVPPPPDAGRVSGAVRVGMHFSEVGRALDTGPPPTPAYPRLRDWFPPDEFGTGRLDYTGNGVKLVVYFRGGYVAAVDEEPADTPPGSYRYEYRGTPAGP